MITDQVAVIGAGTMGSGIAQVCALAGFEVVLVDVSEAAVARGLETIGGSLERLVKKETLSAAEREAALARIQGSTQYADIRAAAYVIEAATEQRELKLRLLAQIAETVSAQALIASNTS